MIRIRDNWAAIFIPSAGETSGPRKHRKHRRGRREGEEIKKKKRSREDREESLLSPVFERCYNGRTNFLRFDLKCHSRRRGREVNEEGGRDRYRILGIEADEKENRAGSADSHWIPGAPDLIGDDRLNKLSGYLPPLSAPYSDRARGSTIGILFPRRGEKRFWIGINRLT